MRLSVHQIVGLLWVVLGWLGGVTLVAVVRDGSPVSLGGVAVNTSL